MSAFLWILSGTALVGATILLWGRYEYLKQKRIGEELDREREALDKQLLEEELERARLEQVRLEQQQLERQRQATNAAIQGQGHRLSVNVQKKEVPAEIVYPMSRAQAAPTMKPTVNPAPKRSNYSVGNKTQTSKPATKTTARSTSRRDDDDYDYNTSTVLGSTWGSYSSNNDDNSSSWGSSSSNDSCGHSSSSSNWGSSGSSSSDWGSSSSSSDSSSSWCD